MDMPVFLRPQRSRILVFATTRWQLAARIGLNFLQRGCTVAALVPRGHPAECVDGLERVHRFQPLLPQLSLAAALRKSQPDLVVPCDDDAVLALQSLLAQGGRNRIEAARWRELLVRSLGNVEACALAGSRSQFMALARKLGIRTPADVPADSLESLRRWMASHAAEVVLKADFSFGGQGVIVARDEEALERAWRQLERRPGWMESLARSLLERDATPLARRTALRGASGEAADTRGLSAQRRVEGHPANRAVACWRGEVLAGVSVQAIRQQHATGPATVVRVIHCAEMEAAVSRLVRHLGVSGFVGFDFMIESATGHALLIEMNARATPACHLPDARAAALTAALLCRLRGEPLPAPVERPGHGVMVMFPGEWRANPSSPYLQAAGHDVPWSQPGLIRDGLAPPWQERGWLAQLKRRTVLARR